MQREDDVVIDTHKVVCKPFRETGYCGYGDSCKYSHSRHAEVESVRAAAVSKVCGICSKTFSEEVVTECGHSFCSLCAMRRYQEVDGCNTCGKPTYGRFWVR